MKRKKNETICTVPFGERSGKQRPLPTDCHKKIGTAHPLTSLLTSLQCHVTKEEPISTLKEREREKESQEESSEQENKSVSGPGPRPGLGFGPRPGPSCSVIRSVPVVVLWSRFVWRIVYRVSDRTRPWLWRVEEPSVDARRAWGRKGICWIIIRVCLSSFCEKILHLPPPSPPPSTPRIRRLEAASVSGLVLPSLSSPLPPPPPSISAPHIHVAAPRVCVWEADARPQG